MSRKPILAVSAAALAALALGLSACGGDSSSADAAATTTPPATAPATTAPTETATGAGSAVSVTADPSGALAFTETALTASAGEVTLVLVNPAPVPHNIAVKGQDAVSETIQDGGNASITVDLPAGEYEYYCAVPGHEAAGMKGTLTVE